MTFRVFLTAALLAVASFTSACAGAPEAASSPQEEPIAAAPAAAAPAAQITWPAVTQVLDGTDLIQLAEIKLVPFNAAEAAGDYDSEQGGSILSLSVNPEGGALQIERRAQEPGEDPHRKQYSFTTISAEGAATAQQDAFLRQTSEGMILLEQNSELDTIPATYWVHYIRKK